MAGDITYGIEIDLKGRAWRGVKKLRKQFERLGKARDRIASRFRGGMGGGLFGGFATGGGGGPGGLGGIVSGAIGGAGSLLTAPTRIVGAFANIIPGIGGIFSGVVNTAGNILGGLVNVAGNVAGGIVNAFTSMAKKVASVTGRMVGGATRMLGKIGLGGAAAFGTVTTMAVRSSGQVQDAWSKVKTILDLGNAASRIKRQVENIAISAGRDLTETVQGFYQVISAGVKKPVKAMKLLKTTMEAAAGGDADFPTVVKATTRTLRAFGKRVDKARSVTDLLLKSVKVGQIEMPELSSVIGGVGNAAAAAGGKLRSALGALGIMAQSGPVAEVATRLRGVFLSLAKPTEKTKKAFRKLKKQGIDVTRRALERLGLIRYLKRLQKVPRDMLGELFPDRRAFLGIQTLLKKLPAVRQAVATLGKAAGTTKQDFRTMMDDLLSRWNQAWQAMLSVARSYAKPIRQVVEKWLEKLPEAFKDWRGAAKKAGEAVANVLDKRVLPAAKKAYNWLVKRDWSQAFSGLRKLPGRLARDVLPKIGELFAKVTKQGIEPGPITSALLAAFRWTASKIRGIFSKLWNDVLGDLRKRVARGMLDMAIEMTEHLQQKEEKWMRQNARDWWESYSTHNPMGAFFQHGTLAPWEDLDKETKQNLLDKYGNLSKTQEIQSDAMRKAIGGIRGMAEELHDVSTPKEQQRAADRRAKQQTRAAKELSKAVKDLRKEIGQIGEAAGQTAQQTLPPEKQPSGGGGAAAPTPVEKLKESPRWKRIQKSIDRLTALEKNLRRAGYTQKAENVARKLEARRAHSEELLERARGGGHGPAPEASPVQRRNERRLRRHRRESRRAAEAMEQKDRKEKDAADSAAEATKATKEQTQAMREFFGRLDEKMNELAREQKRQRRLISSLARA